MAARRAAPKPKAPRKHPGNQTRTPRGRKGSAVPRKAPIHTRKKVHPSAPTSHRYHPDGRHMPEEMVGGFKCKHCGYPGWREHRVVGKEGVHHATLAFAGCTSCGTLHPTHVGVAHRANTINAKGRVRKMADLSEAERLDVRKSIDSSETALGRQEGPEGVGHRTGCPRGGNDPCGGEKGGRCTTCDWQVRDHQALGKTHATLIDLRKLAGIE